jgi:hypothetical protein
MEPSKIDAVFGDEKGKKKKGSRKVAPKVYKVGVRKFTQAQMVSMRKQESQWAHARVLRKRRLLAEVKMHQAAVASLQADLKAGVFR